MIHFIDDVDVQLVRHSAKDEYVAQAARVSTLGEIAQTKDVDVSKDAALIHWLMKDRHGSPFEHNSMTFLVRAPIFVFREWHRHRAGWSYNEESGRYRELRPDFYVPGRSRPLIQEGKPGDYRMVGAEEWQHELVEEEMVSIYEYAYSSYQEMLREGIAREVARMVLPVGIFSSMYATCNARSLMHFLSLRTSDELASYPSHPLAEIEYAAKQMESIFSALMPYTHAAFTKYGRVAP